MFSLLSVLALVVMSGCNTSSGTSSTTTTETNSGTNEGSQTEVGDTTGDTSNSISGETIVVNGQEVAADSTTFGVSDTLGTPPDRPN